MANRDSIHYIPPKRPRPTLPKSRSRRFWQWKIISPRLAELEDFPQLYQRYQIALKGERAFFLPFFLDPQASREFSGEEISKIHLKTHSKDALYYLELMDLCIHATDDSPIEFRSRVEFIMDEFEDMSLMESIDRAMTKQLMLSATAVANNIVMQVEHNRLATLAMQVQKYRHKFDHWPNDLDALNEIGVDPTTLAPVNRDQFGYRIEANGQVVLWGIHQSHFNPIPTDPPPADKWNASWVWVLQDLQTNEELKQ